MGIRFWKNNDRERRALLQKLEREGLNFEKWIITLATGTLVLSMSFLERSGSDGSGMLIASWIALVLSIFFGLVDRLLYIYSISSHPLLTDDGDEETWDKYWAWSERMSRLQILTFFVGVVLLLLFAIKQQL